MNVLSDKSGTICTILGDFEVKMLLRENNRMSHMVLDNFEVMKLFSDKSGTICTILGIFDRISRLCDNSGTIYTVSDHFEI